MRTVAVSIALAFAAIGLGSCSPYTLSTCGHEGSVRGSVIGTHAWPVPDITAAYVDADARWESFGWTPHCTGVGVQGMGGPVECYWNTIQYGTRLEHGGCRGDVVSERSDWNHLDIRGFYYSDGDRHWQIYATVFAADDRLFSGSCTLHGDSIPSGARFTCAPHFIQ